MWKAIRPGRDERVQIESVRKCVITGHSDLGLAGVWARKAQLHIHTNFLCDSWHIA